MLSLCLITEYIIEAPSKYRLNPSLSIQEIPLNYALNLLTHPSQET